MDVDGLTKARMLSIEGASVVSGSVNGSGHLILTKHDGTTIDAGNVKGANGAAGATGATGPPGPVAEPTNDGNNYVRQNGLWVPLSDAISPLITKTQTVTGAASWSLGSAQIAFMTTPTVSVDSILDVAAFWTGVNNVANDEFQMKIQVDGVTKGAVKKRFGGVNDRNHFSIPTTTLVTVSAGSHATIVVILDLIFGSGTLTEENSGQVTATLIPA